MKRLVAALAAAMILPLGVHASDGNNPVQPEVVEGAGTREDIPEQPEAPAEAWDKTKDAADRTWEATKEGADRAAGWTREKSGQAWEATKEGTGTAVEWTREKSRQAWEATKETADKTGDAVKKGYEKTREGVGGDDE